MAAASVLIIDHEPRTLGRMGKVLRKSGYQVRSVDNRERALTLVRRPPAVHLALVNEDIEGAGGGSLITDLRLLSPSTAALLMCRQGATAPAVPPGIEVIWKPFSAATLLRRVEQVLSESAKAYATLGADLDRAARLQARARLLLDEVAEAGATASATTSASQRSRCRPAQPSSGDHWSAQAVDDYALGRLKGARNALEDHLLVCDECQERLAEADVFVRTLRSAIRELQRVPVDVTHMTDDGPVRLLVEKAEKGYWKASFAGQQLEGAARFPGVIGANEYILESFRLMFPEHECDESCGA